MKKPEMLTLLLSKLHGQLPESSEFHIKKSAEALVRKIPGGRQELGIPLVAYAPEYFFSFVMCIRIDVVEDIFHLFSKSPTPHDRSMSTTTITRLEYFTGGSKEIKVVTAEDVTAAISNLSETITSKIIPFFDSNLSVQSLDQSVNGPKPGFDITRNPSGAMHSVILAHLADNPDFRNIVDRHRAKMQLASDTDHQFNSLVKHLESLKKT